MGNGARVAAVVDYQNVHLTAHDRFMVDGQARHLSLLHPLHLVGNALMARKLARARAKLEDEPVDNTAIAVKVFRGLPSNKEDPQQYRRVQAQASEWTRDRRVQVVTRPLRYRDSAGRRIAQEKGIDVLVALQFVRLVESAEFDLVILVAHDTDLEPALEYGLDTAPARDGRVQIETCGWQGMKRLRPHRATTWHTYLDETVFTRSLDRKDYT